MKKEKFCFIRFYLYGKYLGAGYVCERSLSKDRVAVARKRGINFYNKIEFVGRGGTGHIFDFRYSGFNDFQK